MVIAFAFPAVGATVKHWNLVKIAIFGGFLITGLTLQTSSIAQQLRNIRGLVAAVISCFVLFFTFYENHTLSYHPV